MNINPEDIGTINPADLEDFSPEQIAQTIFNQNPKDACSCQIGTFDPDANMTYIFEILLIILMEGFCVLTGGLEGVNLDELTEDHFSMLNPWFRSLGFDIKVNQYDFEEKELYSKYYCKTMVKSEMTKNFFLMRKIQKPYHFLLNGDCLDEYKNCTVLESLHTVFIHGPNVFKISFKFIR